MAKVDYSRSYINQPEDDIYELTIRQMHKNTAAHDPAVAKTHYYEHMDFLLGLVDRQRKEIERLKGWIAAADPYKQERKEVYDPTAE